MSGVVYILASKKNGTLYIGVTNNIFRRLEEHRSGMIAGFTKKYDIKLLVYYEVYPTMYDAISREKQIKEWKRKRKTDLIERMNPDWLDLSYDL